MHKTVIEDLIPLLAIVRQTLPGSFQKILTCFFFRGWRRTQEKQLSQINKSRKVDGSSCKKERVEKK